MTLAARGFNLHRLSGPDRQELAASRRYFAARVTCGPPCIYGQIDEAVASDTASNGSAHVDRKCGRRLRARRRRRNGSA
jgi:hypothetical protein